MGFFRNIVDAALDANETAHGKRLHAEFLDTLRILSGMDRSIADEAIARFVAKRSKLVQPMKNWTNDGRIQVASNLRREARKTIDMNMVEGYALWFTSAWLEASARSSPMAQDVFGQLDNLADGHERIAANETKNQPHRSAPIALSGELRLAEPEVRSQPSSLKEQVLALLPKLDAQSASGRVPALLGTTRVFFSDCFYRVSAHKWEFGIRSRSISPETAVARVAGMAMAVAHSARDSADPLEVLGYSLKYLHEAGLDQHFVNRWFFEAIDKYSPRPMTPAGADALLGAELMRRYLNGADKEFNIAGLSRDEH